MQANFIKSHSLCIFEHPNTRHANKQIYRYTPPPPSLPTKSLEGSEFGQQYNYFFQSENDELKPKYKLNGMYVIAATHFFEGPFLFQIFSL